MKYLLYYKLDSKFISDQMAVGGDGTKVVSVVDGVAWTDDEENVYYRLNGEASAVTSYTVTVYYRYVSGSSYTSVTQQSVYTVNCYSGYSAEVTLFPKQVSGYVPKNESTALTVSGNMTYVFEYYKESEVSIPTKYTTTAAGETVRLYFSESFGNSLLKIVIDGVSFGASSMQSAFTFSRAGEHTVVYYLKDMPTSLPEATFMGCSNLSEIDIPKTVTNIGAGSFKNCSSLKSLVIPEGVTSLPGRWVSWIGATEPHSGMCDGCSSLVSITLPFTLTSVGYCCFTDCSALSKIKLPDGLTTIGAAAFRNCSSLTEITIPSGVTSIAGVIRSGGYDYGVFAGCRNLVKIVSLATVAPTIYSSYYGTFFNVHSNGTLYYPNGSDYSAWLSSESQKYRLGYYGWSGVEIDKVINVEYVEATAPAIDDSSSAITTDLNLSDPDAFARFKAVFSFYMPSLITGTTRMISCDKFISMFYNNGGNFRETSYRLGPNNVRIVEHDTFSSAPNTSGANILCVVYNYKSQGHGSYYKITGNLTSPQNNYPYSSFDSYNIDNTSRLYYNYTDSGGFADTAIQLFKQNIFPGTRFYGLKIYGYGENDAEPTTVVYDFVPVYNETQGAYGFFEKNNLKFYTREDLTGPAIS